MMPVFLVFLLLAQSGVLYAAARSSSSAGNRMAERALVRLFEKKMVCPVLRAVQSKYLGSEPASEQYQLLAREAQEKLVRPKDRVPIFKMVEAFPLSSSAAAFTTPIGIFLNEPRVDSRTYGAKRALLYHEIEHVCNRDLTMISLVSLSTFLATAGITNALLVPVLANPRAAGTASLVLACSAAVFAFKKYQKYMERRADIDGHMATHCAECVHESAKQRYQDFVVDDNVLKDSGYLQPDQLEGIAEQLREKHLFCAVHKGIQGGSFFPRPVL